MENELNSTLNSLNILNKEISAFIKKVRPYQNAHRFFKSNRDNINLKIRAVWLTLHKNDSISEYPLIVEIGKVLSEFLDGDKLTADAYSHIQMNLTLKLQELAIELQSLSKSVENGEIIYDKGSRFDFHVDIKNIIGQAKKEIIIVDSWINEDLLEMYLKVLNDNVNILILTNKNNPKGNFVKVANYFKSQHKGSFEARETEFCHDRAIFYDNSQGWVMGQSIKDAAKNKPTYMIKLKNPLKLQSIYMHLWSSAKKIA